MDSATPWTAVHQASLSFLVSWSLLKFMSIESVMLSNHVILYLCWQSDLCFLICCLGFVMAFLPRSKHLLISWLPSLSTVILEPKKIVCHCSTFSPSFCHEVVGPSFSLKCSKCLSWTILIFNSVYLP